MGSNIASSSAFSPPKVRFTVRANNKGFRLAEPSFCLISGGRAADGEQPCPQPQHRAQTSLGSINVPREGRGAEPGTPKCCSLRAELWVRLGRGLVGGCGENETGTRGGGGGRWTVGLNDCRGLFQP